jgi:guanylate kinase
MIKPKILGNLDKGLIFIISAPAGTGKTTLVGILKKEFPCIIESISYTTRKPRSNEINGRDYFFISDEEFKAKIKKREFLEYSEVFGSYYGTSKDFVFQQQEKGNHVILVIDTQGAKKLKKYNFISIFISPPTIKELQYRLHARKSETEKMIQNRLSFAQKEIDESIKYDYHVINDELDTAYQVIKSILIAEEHKVRKTNKEVRI